MRKLENHVVIRSRFSLLQITTRLTVLGYAVHELLHNTIITSTEKCINHLAARLVWPCSTDLRRCTWLLRLELSHVSSHGVPYLAHIPKYPDPEGWESSSNSWHVASLTTLVSSETLPPTHSYQLQHTLEGFLPRDFVMLVEPEHFIPSIHLKQNLDSPGNNVREAQIHETAAH